MVTPDNYSWTGRFYVRAHDILGYLGVSFQFSSLTYYPNKTYCRITKNQVWSCIGYVDMVWYGYDMDMDMDMI